MSAPRRTLPPMLIAAALLLSIAFGVFVMSARVSPIFSFREDVRIDLAADESIRGIAAFERDSYLIGEIARYTIIIAWRPDRVSPELDTFARTVSFHPFDHRDSKVVERRVGPSLREYIAEFDLQVVAADSATSHALPAPTLYYTRADEEHADVHPLRMNSPVVHVGEYYPGSAAAVPLKPPKPAVHDLRGARRALMAVSGSGLAMIAALSLWLAARRRTASELTQAERCWQDLRSIATDSERLERTGLEALERCVTRAVELRTGVDPAVFWSGKAPADADQRDAIDEARPLLESMYRPSGSDQVDSSRLRSIAEELLAPLVEQRRLELELENDPAERLRAQPRVLGAAGLLGALGIVALVLAALPSVWLASDVKRYNAAVALIEADTGLQPAVDAFATLSEEAGDSRVRSASFYNLGTLLADPRMTRLSREQYRNFREAILLSGITLERLLHDLELDAEFELVTLLSELTRQHVRAEQALQAAVRARPQDPDAARNLEVVGKIRAAIGRSLARLVEEAEQDGGSELAGQQTVIDLRVLMETELPDDFARIDEGKDDSEYYIMERF